MIKGHIGSEKDIFISFLEENITTLHKNDHGFHFQ